VVGGKQLKKQIISSLPYLIISLANSLPVRFKISMNTDSALK
jgi:hypothetical protein